MKNNSFRYLHLFLVVCSLGLIFSPFSSKDGAEKTETRREPTSLPKKKFQQRRHSPQAEPLSRAYRGPASAKPYDKLNITSTVQADYGFRMTEGNVFAANIGAIPLSEWQPGMTPLLYDDGVYGYFKKKAGDKNTIPVAYNKGLKKLSPISSIVHVRGVDESTRQALKAQGFQEYYYFKNIGRLSLKSSPGEVVKLYEALNKQGLKVKLEVLQEKPIAH